LERDEDTPFITQLVKTELIIRDSTNNSKINLN